MSGFEVLNAGLFASIQDLGRQGYAHLGISHSGAMDEYAYRWSQKLLQHQKQNQNALELMAGLRLKATAPTQIAITGANLSFKINAQEVTIWQTHQIKAGDILSFDKRVSGQRAYLAVKEGFILKKQYRSYSTTLKENIGARVQKGDFLAFNPYSAHNRQRVKSLYIPNYEKPLILRLLLSYQEAYFEKKEKEKFFASKYEVTLQSDRMGYRLKGEAITPSRTDIISEGIAFGSIQIPKGGQPIVLLKERQTIGGYPKIGTVIPLDCFKLAQAPIGSQVAFEKIGIEEAQKLMKRYMQL